MAGESIAQGMTLKLKQGTGTSTAIGDLVSLSGPSTDRTIINLGAADSTNSENIQKPGRSTRGAYSFTVNVDMSSADQIRAVYAQLQMASTDVNDSTHATAYFTWEITFDDGTTYTFPGFVSAFNMDGADDGLVMATFGVTLQGDVAFG